MGKEIRVAKAAAALEPLRKRFEGQTALIFASGPSLTQLWSPERSLMHPSIAVNDAWRIVPNADVLYGTDNFWWQHHAGVPSFKGVRVGYEGPGPAGIVWVSGSGGEGYDERLGWIRHGLNSGHAAAHLAAQLGAKRIVLVGVDCRLVGGKQVRGKQRDGKAHFFGEHDRAIRKTMPFPIWVERFAILHKALAAIGVELVHATPGSALTIPSVKLEDICPDLAHFPL